MTITLKVSDVARITVVDVLSTAATSSTTATSETHPPAYDEWGDESTFSYDNSFRDAATTGFQVKNDDKHKRNRYNYSEEGRGYTDYKVTKSDDPDVYVIVRRVTEMSFSGPGGAQFNLILANDTVGTKEGSGQEPPAPPSLEQMG